MKKFNPNKIDINQKDYIEEVSDNWDELSTRFISQYNRGEITKKEILNVAEKVAKYKGDDGLVELIKQRMGLSSLLWQFYKLILKRC